MKVIAWNLDWASPKSQRGKFIQDLIELHDPDVVCYTEAYMDIVPSNGYIISSNEDYGYKITHGRRKVILWSKIPWTDTDDIGSEHLPSGRFISGRTQSVRFIGVCIPWRDAHVRTGNKNKLLWEDHAKYLENLAPIIKKQSDQAICLIGDFNQTIPRSRQPMTVYNRLTQILDPKFKIITSEEKDKDNKLLIDHIAITGLKGTFMEVIESTNQHGLVLSDHVGILCELNLL